MSYQLIDVNGPISLSWVLPFSGGLTIASFNNLVVKPDSKNPGLALPIASEGATGNNAIFNNIGTLPCLLQTYGGGNPTGAAGDYHIQPGAIISVYLTKNDDANGTWCIIPFGGGASGIISLTAKGLDGSVVVTNDTGAENPTINAPGGTVNFTANKSISNLLLLKDTDDGLISVFKDSNGALSYNTVAIQEGQNINVTNAKGGANSPIIDLNTELKELSSIAIGTTKINSNTITAPNGMNISTGSTTQVLTLNKMTIDVNGNVTIPGSISATGSSFIEGHAQAFAYFLDNGTGCDSSITIQDQVNIKSITGSKGNYVITFTNPFKSATYVPTLSLSMQPGGGFGAPYLVYTTIKLAGSISISCIDLQGNLCAPKSGVSIAIFSQTGLTSYVNAIDNKYYCC